MFRVLAARFSKKIERITKKLEVEKQIKSGQTLESAAEQVTLSNDQIYELVTKRQEFILKLTQQTVIPKEAYIIGAATLAPLGFLSFGTLGACALGMTPWVAPMLYASLKYAAINVCFQSGIHWGFAMSMHECQLDAFNSSNEARWHFALATIPILATMLLVQHFFYGKFEEYKVIGGVVGLVLLNVGIFALDVRARRQTPGWFVKMKGFYSFGFQFCLFPLAFVALKFQNQIIQKPSPYRLQL